MARIKTSGLDVLNTELNKLATDINKINRGALGDGARVVAEAISQAINSMPVCDDGYYAGNKKKYGATESEKQQIAENFGIAKFKTANGSTNTSIGFTGYVNTTSKAFNGRIPTGMLMQCIEYGTNFRQGTHTITNATKSIKSEVEKAIQDYIDKEVSNIVK